MGSHLSLSTCGVMWAGNWPLELSIHIILEIFKRLNHMKLQFFVGQNPSNTGYFLWFNVVIGIKKLYECSGLLVSNPVCRKLRSWHPFLTANKNWKSESHNFFEIHKKSKVSGQTTASKIGEIGEYRESQFTRAEIHKQKTLRKPAPGWKNQKCNWWISGVFVEIFES